MLSPPLACVPICFFFLGLAIIILFAFTIGGVVVKSPEGAPKDEATHRPPYWVAFAVFIVCCVLLFLLSFVTDG